MEKTPQTLLLSENTGYTLPCPEMYAPESFEFAGWKSCEDGRVYSAGDYFRAQKQTLLTAVWRDIREYRDIISLSVAKYNDGFVRHKKSAILSKELFCGVECLKVMPLEANVAMEDTVNLDGYRYKGAQINIGKYNYAILIMHSEQSEMPSVTFAANSGNVLKSPVRIKAQEKTDLGEWAAYTFDLGALKPFLGDTCDYCIWQLYIHPYDTKTLPEISGNKSIYLAKLMFLRYNPNIGIQKKLLSECFKCKEISEALQNDGVMDSFPDTEITYITSNGKFAALLTDTADLCNKNTEPDFEAGEYFVKETDKKCQKRISEIRSTKTSVKIKGTKYYVANDGCDQNDGLSENTPWKTTERVNSAELKSGDGVFFKRGDIWHNTAIKAAEGVTYSAYGDGEKPKLYGSPENGADASKWTLYSNGDGKKVWLYYTEIYDVGLIVFDDEKHTTKAIPSFIDGKFVHRDNPEKQFDVKCDLCEDLMLFSEIIPSPGGWVSSSKGRLYLRCDAGNPGEIFKSIEFNTRPSIIECGAKSGITVDNLCLKHSGTIAVHAWDGTEKTVKPIKNLTVRNCEIGWIGGGIQFYAPSGVNTGKVTRLGNGIEIYGGCENYTIDNCYIYQCYDAGLTIQSGASAKGESEEMKNVSFTGNIIDYCIYGMEIWNGNDNGLEGRTGDNIKVSGNIIRYCGEGFGNQRPNPGTSAAIMGFYHENVFRNYTVKNNIFIKSIDNLLHFTSEYSDTLPRCDGNTYVQTKDSKLGYCGAKAGIRYDFDMTAEATINNIFGDKNAKVYYVK